MITSLLLFLACGQKAEPECTETKACPFGSVCVEGVCETQGCATSDQCAIEQYCKESQCVDGCAESSDCMFGDVCDTATNTCVVGECTNAKTDCGFGQFCSPTGECYDAGGYYCRPCQDDGDCGGGGNYCLTGYGYCGVECATDSDCPGGYDCLPLSDVSGNVVTHQCFAACWLQEGESR